MDAERPVSVLEGLLTAKGEHLLRTAVLMTGSQDEAEDLLQAALERVFRRWRSISGDPEGYLRRTMYHLAADGWRRKQAWRARLGLLTRPDTQPDTTDVVDRETRRVRRRLTVKPRLTADLRHHVKPLPKGEGGRRQTRSGDQHVVDLHRDADSVRSRDLRLHLVDRRPEAFSDRED
ncbi:MAG TPA: sigma factor [Streptosporangiaceae bacterium]